MAQRSCRRARLSAEQAIVLAAARSELGPEHEDQMARPARQRVDWEFLWSLARAHGVGCFVGRHLLERNGGRLPAPFARQIKGDLCRETARALVLREHQLRLNAELQRANVAVLWLKGLILAERLYGRFEARHCGDLDLLVEPADMPRAEEILARLGLEPYQPPRSGLAFHPLAAHHALWSLRLADDWLLMVELHHRLSGPPACQPGVDRLLAASRTVDFQGQTFRIPSLEDELLILCLHAHHHNYSLLRCLMDVAEYVKRYQSQLDWTEFARQAKDSRCLGRVRAALAISDAMLGLELPEAARDALAELTSWQRWCVRSFPLAALLDAEGQDDDGRRARLALLMDGWRDAWSLLAPRLAPSGSYVRAICPPSWPRWPGLPRLYHLFRAVNQLIALLPGFGRRRPFRPPLPGHLATFKANWPGGSASVTHERITS